MTANKKITPSDLRKRAQQLIESCQMPSLDELLQAVFEARRKYVTQILKARAEAELKVSDLLSQSDVSQI
jgi:16S rRNA A1518/A1519 N6-dimethyltransferase RsmA/KsgA/DIM1 with predicted DNA glycosylase/AP lyase activity